MPRHLLPLLVAISLTIACADGAIAAEPGAATQPAAAISRFTFSGKVIDERGQPISGAHVVATHQQKDGKSFGYIGTGETDVDGQFLIDRPVALSGALPGQVGGQDIRLEVTHPDFLPGTLTDMSQMSDEQRSQLQVRLQDGKTLNGRLLDPAGHPLADALVQVEFDRYEFRKAALSDAQGNFQFKGLPDQQATIEALVTDTSQPPMSARVVLDAAKFDQPLTLTLQEIKLAEGKVVHELFGMKLVDVDDTLKESFHLSDSTGVLILDPGPDSARLNIGELKRGDSFWIVGERKVKDFEEFRQTLLDASQLVGNTGTYTCRVVYRFDRPDFSGTNTQHMRLTADDLAKLRDAAP